MSLCKQWIILLIVFLSITAIGQKPMAATIIVGSPISDQTWTLSGSPYVITASINVPNGITLTIQPDVVVQLKPDVSISVSGTLLANTVTFTSFDAIDFWKGIIFWDPTSSGSNLTNCVLEHAKGYTSQIYNYKEVIGCYNGSSPTITGCSISNSTALIGITINGSPTVSNCTIRGFNQFGITFGVTSAPTISGNTFLDNGYGISLQYGEPYVPQISNNTFINNTNGDYLMAGPGTISGNMAWRDPSGTVYHLQRGMHISPGASLTIRPGIIVKVESGGITAQGILDAEGVTFSRGPTNAWTGITFYGAEASAGRLVNCSIQQAAGGSEYSAIWLYSASPEISGCTIANCTSKKGIYVQNSSPIISNCVINGFSNIGIQLVGLSSPSITSNLIGNNSYGIQIPYSQSMSPVISGNNYADNSAADIGVEGSVYENTVWGETAALYMVTGGLSIERGVSLIITPGIRVVVSGNKYIFSRGTLSAHNVTFDWADGATPWKGISFSDPSSNASRLENCSIKHVGGTSVNAAVYINNSSPTIAKCIIASSTAPNGIYVIGTSSPLVKECSITGFSNSALYVTSTSSGPIVFKSDLINNAYGVRHLSNAVGFYRGNRITGNTTYGVYSNITSVTINAEYNYWGDANGPLDTFGGPSTGSGDKVSRYVDYSPWVGYPFDIDNDGIPDLWEEIYFLNTTTANETTDLDDDSLPDVLEFAYGTDPKNKDSDSDGVEDGLEVQVGMNPSQAGDYNIDSDNDTYSNLREQISGTDPYDASSIPPVLADGDPLPSGDGDVDGGEIAAFISEYGRTDCSPCKYDLDTDGDVDIADLFLFSEDFGRTLQFGQ